MELTATYKELSSYIQARFGQPVSLSAGEGGELKVTYTKRILIKDVNISIWLHFDHGSFIYRRVACGPDFYATSQQNHAEAAGGLGPQKN